MKQRIYEAGTIAADTANKKFRVCLISEGKGSSADFPREFFIAENAQALAGSLSFSGHPLDLTKPHQRDPMSAIASISEELTIEEHDGLMGIWGDYIPSKSKPQVAEYLAEYGPKLGLSVFADCDGHNDPSTGKFIAESLDGGDPYKSVDLVVAAGARGKFERVAEAKLLTLTEASATAGGKEETHMDKDIEDRFAGLSKLVEGLVSTLEGKAKADLQIEADTAAVNKAVEGRLTNYDKAVTLISEAKLTKSQSASLQALALTGADIAPAVEHEKKVLAEALASADAEEESHKIAEGYLGGSGRKSDVGYDVVGFGKVS